MAKTNTTYLVNTMVSVGLYRITWKKVLRFVLFHTVFITLYFILM